MSHYLHIRCNINPTLVFLGCIYLPLSSIAPVITFQRERYNVSAAPWAKAVGKKRRRR